MYNMMILDVTLMEFKEPAVKIILNLYKHGIVDYVMWQYIHTSWDAQPYCNIRSYYAASLRHSCTTQKFIKRPCSTLALYDRNLWCVKWLAVW